jgi:hypothetical protein
VLPYGELKSVLAVLDFHKELKFEIKALLPDAYFIFLLKIYEIKVLI